MTFMNSYHSEHDQSSFFNINTFFRLPFFERKGDKFESFEAFKMLITDPKTNEPYSKYINNGVVKKDKNGAILYRVLGYTVQEECEIEEGQIIEEKEKVTSSLSLNDEKTVWGLPVSK